MLVGVLVDVSGSMKSSLQIHVGPNDENIVRIQTIFTTIINIAKRETHFEDTHEIFALAFGLSYLGMKTCDLFQLLDIFKNVGNSLRDGKKALINLLSENGAPHSKSYVNEYLEEKDADFIFLFYSANKHLLKQYIENLPSQCKSLTSISSRITIGAKQNFLISFLAKNSINRLEERKTKEHAMNAIKNAQIVLSNPIKISFKQAVDLLEANKNRRITSRDHLNELIDLITPYIFGDTPMCMALKIAIDLFKLNCDQNKNIFLLTDGEATDGNPVDIVQELRNNGVTVFVCLLTEKNIPQPRKLYYESQPEWTDAQNIMFNLSSVVDHSNSAFSVLLENGWQIPETGESHLFIQANHPKVIEEFSNLVVNIQNSNDPILNIAARITLDEYINSSISEFDSTLQIHGTCYASAVAAVIHFATKRIEGRDDGYPEFNILRETLINEYKKNGANTKMVLEKYTNLYRLRYKEVDEREARQAINQRRPVVATYSLYIEEWIKFHKFYEANPLGILKNEDLLNEGNLTVKRGHSVILIKCAPNYLKLLNSLGTEIADNGFFRVLNQSVLNLKFYDVYWELEDLSPNELSAFEQKKLNTGTEFARRLPQSILNMPYKCHVCHLQSPISQYEGQLNKSICPKCNKHFNPTVIGLTLSPYDT